MSNQSGTIETFEELKASGHSIKEVQNDDGTWTVNIGHLLGTANAFPGTEATSNDLELARRWAFDGYLQWMANMREFIEKATSPIPNFVDRHGELMSILMEIRDELRKANSRPLYIVVNDEKSMRELIDLIENEGN